MTRRSSILALGMLLAAAAVTPVAGQGTPQPQLSAREIMERNFFVTKVATLRLDLTMTLINDRGQRRERRSTTMLKLQPNGVDSKFLVRFSEPPDVAGTGLLQIEHSEDDDDLWIYLPALKKARRLVASNKKDSFVGSDFSYGDIALPKVDRYQHTLRSSEQVDGVTCYVVESTPGSDQVRTNSGYARKITWVRTDNFIEAKVEYYDLANRLLKTQRITRPQAVASQPGKWFALEREMTNHQTGHRTLLVSANLDGASPIGDDTFSMRVLERP